MLCILMLCILMLCILMLCILFGTLRFSGFDVNTLILSFFEIQFSRSLDLSHPRLNFYCVAKPIGVQKPTERLGIVHPSVISVTYKQHPDPARKRPECIRPHV